MEIATLCNRSGLVLAFVSVWLLWPGILGEHRLKTIERWTRSVLKSGVPRVAWLLTTAILWALIGTTIVKFGIYEHLGEYRAKDRFIGMMFFLVLITIPVAAEFIDGWVTRTVCLPALEALVQRTALRQRLSDIGIATLVAGFALQFVASYLSSD